MAKETDTMDLVVKKKQQVKTLTIDMTGGEANFVWEGFWSGHDVVAVQAMLRRAYYTHKRDVRRKDQASLTKEVTNDHRD